MTISVGIHWCLTPNFPFGDLYLSTIWPVLFIMIAANRSWLPIISRLAMCVASQIQKFVEVRLLQQHLIVVLNAKLVRHPQELIYVPVTALHAPTSDVNVTAGLALATSHSYFYAGLQSRGLSYVDRYVSPVAYLLPINVLEDFSKPLSLSFRLLGNIMADELTIAVLASLVAFIIPVAVMCLGIFTSAIQALVFATLAGAYISEATDCHYRKISPTPIIKPSSGWQIYAEQLPTCLTKV